MKLPNAKGFSPVVLVIGILLLLAVGATWYASYRRQSTPAPVSTSVYKFPLYDLSVTIPSNWEVIETTRYESDASTLRFAGKECADYVIQSKNEYAKITLKSACIPLEGIPGAQIVPYSAVTKLRQAQNDRSDDYDVYYVRMADQEEPSKYSYRRLDYILKPTPFDVEYDKKEVIQPNQWVMTSFSWPYVYEQDAEGQVPLFSLSLTYTGPEKDKAMYLQQADDIVKSIKITK